jgi:hypothetical protein
MRRISGSRHYARVQIAAAKKRLIHQRYLMKVLATKLVLPDARRVVDAEALELAVDNFLHYFFSAMNGISFGVLNGDAGNNVQCAFAVGAIDP